MWMLIFVSVFFEKPVVTSMEFETKKACEEVKKEVIAVAPRAKIIGCIKDDGSVSGRY